MTTSGETISRYSFHEVQNAESIVKIIIAVNYFYKTLHRRCLTGFWICFEFWICQHSENTGVLNMPGLFVYRAILNMLLILSMWGFWIYHSFKYVRVTQVCEYVWIISGYVWLCLNVPKSVWMAFVLHLLIIVIPYIKELLT